MTALVQATARLDDLARELRELIEQRCVLPRDGNAALTALIDQRAREVERLADELQTAVAAVVSQVAERHSRAFEQAAVVALRERRILAELARIRGRALDLDASLAVAMDTRALVNPWSGDALAAPKTVPSDILPEHLRAAHRAIASARQIDPSEPTTRRDLVKSPIRRRRSFRTTSVVSA